MRSKQAIYLANRRAKYAWAVYDGLGAVHRVYGDDRAAVLYCLDNDGYTYGRVLRGTHEPAPTRSYRKQVK